MFCLFKIVKLCNQMRCLILLFYFLQISVTVSFPPNPALKLRTKPSQKVVELNSLVTCLVIVKRKSTLYFKNSNALSPCWLHGSSEVF